MKLSSYQPCNLSAIRLRAMCNPNPTPATSPKRGSTQLGRYCRKFILLNLGEMSLGWY